jgi:asparagine synthase (glutamine-hydrolysing)
MCGISGIVHWGLGNPQALSRGVDAMVAALSHRGPDAQGTTLGSIAALGSTRLSIVDLSDEANQPMQDATGRWHLVYNGEIYNYMELREELAVAGWRFRTQSDTEVVLAALVTWGPEAVRRFNGMWALALVDELERTVLLSRDRFGVKPLFFHRTNDGRLLFASEVKALLAAEPSLADVDDVQVARFLLLSVIAEGERTVYRRIERVPASSNLVARSDGVTTKSYWSYPSSETDTPSFAESCEKFVDLLQDAVRVRLRADVPVATTLSGGLDSSAILAFVKRLGVQDHTTYTASFPGAWFDEGERAREFSESLGFRSRNISRHAEQLDLSVFGDIIKHMDGPTLNPSTIPLWEIMQAIHEDGTKVVLDGQGADELLGGYTNQVAPYGALDALAQRGIGAAWKELHDFSKLWGPKEAILWSVRTQVPGSLAIYQRLAGMRRFIGPRLRSLDPGELSVPVPRGDSHVNRRLRWQHVMLLRPLLDYEDRISMAHSVEGRMPFLDYRLVEFITALPGRYKVRGGTGKVLEREALRRILPPHVLSRRKLGFVAPVQKWFSGTAGRNLVERMADGHMAREGYVDPAALRRLVGCSPSIYTANALFRLLGLEVWLGQLATE